MSTSACDQCARPIKAEDEFITCMAFCERAVHLHCTGSERNKIPKLNKPFAKIVQENPNLIWMCDDCAKLMKMARFKSTLSSFGDAFKAITDKQESVHSEIKKQLAKQGQQIAQLSKRLTPSSPTVQESRVFSGQPPSKRRRDEELTISKPLVGGTKIVAESSVITVPEPVELLWMYLSRIHPNVTPDAVEKLVKECIEGADTIKAIPLVKRGVDTSRMSFISYKIGIDPKFRETALNADTWPKGILFREFEDHSAKNLWQPPPKTPTIQISHEPGTLATPTSVPEEDPIR